MMPTKLRTHTATAGQVSRTTWNDREHLIVPVVMIVEGVLNGELVTQEAISEFPLAWDGRPVVINHPTDRGVFVSANLPGQLEQAIGTVFNAHVDGNKLKADMYIDVAKAPEIVAQFEAGHLMEVSTGYFADTTPNSGLFGGITYNAIQSDIRPDHLAVLPHDVGACSVSDGCGAPRINSRSPKEGNNVSTPKNQQLSPMQRLMTFAKRLLSNEGSANETWSALNAALGVDAYVIDYYDDLVIYEVFEDGGYTIQQRGYSIDEETLAVTWTSEPEAAVARVSYDTLEEPESTEDPEPTANCGCPNSTPKPKPNSRKKAPMKTNRAERRARIRAHEATKDDLIDELIDVDENELTEDNRDALEALDETLLEAMLPEEALEELEEEEEPEPVANLSAEEAAAFIPDPAMRAHIVTLARKEQARQDALISGLVANKRNKFTANELRAMGSDQVEKLAEMLQTDNYAGALAPRNNSSVVEPLTAPSTRKEVN